MASVKWVQQLLEIERRELARKQLLREQAPAIFEMLKAEVTQCIVEWNRVHPGEGTLAVDFGATGEAGTIAIQGRMVLTYKLQDARIEFEFPDKSHANAGSAVVSSGQKQGRFSPVFIMEGQPGQLGVPEFVEHLLKPLLFPAEMIGKLPPSPMPALEPDSARDAERRRAAATQPLI